MSTTTELATYQQTDIARAEDFLPLLSVEQAIARKTQINQYIAGIMTEGDDYGKMPGDTRVDAKKVLLKPGAEKLCSVFGLVPRYVKETVVEDWTGKEHGGEMLFYYEYRCHLSRGGRDMGEAIGSANSWETKYRYRWVGEDVAIRYADSLGGVVDALPKRGGRMSKFEPDFAIAKREAEGKYGHPAEYWDQFTAQAGARRVTDRKLGTRTFNGWEITQDATQYRIPNPDVADTINTLQKMAQKRALVAAVLVVTNCSDAFTQDVEDFEHGTVRETEQHEPEAGRHHIDAGNGKKAPEQQTLDVKAEPEAPEVSPLPESLIPKFNAWAVADLNPLTEGLKEVKQLLEKAMPQNGADEYKRVMEKHGIKPKGNDKAKLRAALVELWNLQEQVPYKPQGVREYESWSSAPDAMDCLGQIKVAGVLYEANKDRTAFNKVEEANVGK